MNKEQLKKDWQYFLIDVKKSETEIAKECGQAQSNLNKKILNGTIKYLELANILERYGYTIDIRRKD